MVFEVVGGVVGKGWRRSGEGGGMAALFRGEVELDVTEATRNVFLEVARDVIASDITPKG